jgi:hypothetical protein
MSEADGRAIAELAPGESKVCRTETSLVQYHVFGHPWEVVIAAHEMRYPTHPDLPLMVSSEVVSRDSSQESAGKEIFTRHAVVRNSAVPRMLSALAGGDTMEFEETYVYDRAVRRAFKTGKNLSFREGSWGIQLDETMEYVVHRDNPDWTWFKLEAVLTLPRLPGGLGSTAEQFFADLYIDGVGRGRKIDQKFVDDIVQSGRLSSEEFLPWGSAQGSSGAAAAAEGEGEGEGEDAWDSGTETELTSYEDAHEGPVIFHARHSAAADQGGPSEADLAAVVAELRGLKQALTEVSRRLDMMGVPPAGTVTAGEYDRGGGGEAQLRGARGERQLAAAAATAEGSWQRPLCVMAALGAGAAGWVNWRYSRAAPVH